MKINQDLNYLKIFGRFLYEINSMKNPENAKKILRGNPQFVEPIKNSLLNVISDPTGRIGETGHKEKYQTNAKHHLDLIENIYF